MKRTIATRDFFITLIVFTLHKPAIVKRKSDEEIYVVLFNQTCITGTTFAIFDSEVEIRKRSRQWNSETECPRKILNGFAVQHEAGRFVTQTTAVVDSFQITGNRIILRNVVSTQTKPLRVLEPYVGVDIKAISEVGCTAEFGFCAHHPFLHFSD